ncbi:MAG TPA: acetate--CoA ligase family protein, partial [Acidimicrobiales bacterium]|nr:acetate--CoA ligase family protein [Acidimicrobiales bacterium]
ASDTPARPNTAMTRKIVAWAEAHGATIHPVNPNREEIDGRPCLPSVLDVPGELDLAVVLVGDAVAAFEQALAKEPRFAVIFSAGFAETGAEGAELQRRLEELVASSRTHLLGPNTNLNAFESFAPGNPGRAIALITQSGHQGRPIYQAQELGLRLCAWAPTGNEVDLEFADFARWFADQPDVGVIAAYIEGFKDGRTLMLAADHAAQRGVPIVVVKVGRTDEGASMAQSHTGHLTGSDVVTDAVFRQLGVHRVDGLDELQDTAAMLSRAAPPTTDGICIYAISGGTGAHLADLAAAGGLRIPPLTEATQTALREWIPGYLRVSNPVDNGGAPSADWRGRKILDALLADPNVGVLVCPIIGALPTMSRPLAEDLVAAAETTDKPIVVIWGSPLTDDPAYTDVLVPSGLPVFRTFGNCVGAVRAYFDHHAFQARYRSPFAEPVTERAPGAEAVDQLVTRASGRAHGSSRTPARDQNERGALSEHDSKAVLAAYGIPVTADVLCRSPAEAARAAGQLGYPVVMKACAPDLVHKSDLGLVVVGVGSGAEVRQTWGELVGRSPVDLDGVLVCPMAEPGVECVVGVSHDELFGPVVMFGLGGVLVEVLGDVTFRVPPFDRDEAHRMVREVQGFPLLTGVRGRPPADVEALVAVIMAAQRLAVDHVDGIAELDINPLVVHEQGATALDALVVLR